MTDKEGIYLIYSRFPNGRYIYKVGMSRNLEQRLKQYPQNYEEVLCIPCAGSMEVEKKVINSISNLYGHGIVKCKYGNEYFESDNNCVETIKRTMYDLCSKYNIKFQELDDSERTPPCDIWVEMARKEIPLAYKTIIVKRDIDIHRNEPLTDINKQKNMNIQRIQSPYIFLEYFAPILEKEDISEKMKDYENVFFFRNKVRVFVILYREKRFDIKTESYIETNFKIKRFIPNICSLKKKEAIEKLKEVVRSEEVDRQTVFSKGTFYHKYNELIMSVKEKREYKALEKKNKQLEDEIKQLKRDLTM